jgi:hypothetical protein
MAWLIDSELSLGKPKDQSTLDDWCDIGEVFEWGYDSFGDCEAIEVHKETRYTRSHPGTH